MHRRPADVCSKGFAALRTPHPLPLAAGPLQTIKHLQNFELCSYGFCMSKRVMEMTIRCLQFFHCMPTMQLQSAVCQLFGNLLADFRKHGKIVETPYYFDAYSHEPRYYQRIAIDRTVEAVAKGQKRILLVVPTGTGKTFTSFQIIHRLTKFGAMRLEKISIYAKLLVYLQ